MTAPVACPSSQRLCDLVDSSPVPAAAVQVSALLLTAAPGRVSILAPALVDPPPPAATLSSYPPPQLLPEGHPERPELLKVSEAVSAINSEVNGKARDNRPVADRPLENP